MAPTEAMARQAAEFKQAFFDHGESVINGDFKWGGMDSYADWLQMVRASLRAETCHPPWGVISTFFAVRAEDRQIIGIANLRHTLTEKFKDAGHIGYSVRPAERRKGYATEMLRQLLAYAKGQGLAGVALVCKADNIGSIRTIEANGGRLQQSAAGMRVYRIARS